VPFTFADLRKPAPSEADKVAFMGGMNTTSLSAGLWIALTNGTFSREPYR
jgi:hypothetical protein